MSLRYTRPSSFYSISKRLAKFLKNATPGKFADDTSLTAVGETLSEVKKRANKDLRNVHNWLSANKLNLNIAKTEYVLVGSRQRINSLDIQPSINIDKQSVKRVKHSEVFGVQIDEHLDWHKRWVKHLVIVFKNCKTLGG